jgi:hypothetical protein
MPTLIDTPFDRLLTSAPHAELSELRPVNICKIWQMFADFCYLMISTTGFIASSILMVLGLPLFIFFALSGWDIGLLATNVGDFVDHFRSADADTRHVFADAAKWAFIWVVAIFHLIRMPSWFARLWARLDRNQAADGSAVQ